MKRRPKKFLNNSNKVLTALVCILAVVCLVAGGIYIDTFHGQGRFLALIGKTNRTQGAGGGHSRAGGYTEGKRGGGCRQ